MVLRRQWVFYGGDWVESNFPFQAYELPGLLVRLLERLSILGETAGQRELKAALTHFIERIEIHGQDVTIEYSFKKPAIAKVPTNGDPGGHRILVCNLPTL